MGRHFRAMADGNTRPAKESESQLGQRTAAATGITKKAENQAIRTCAVTYYYTWNTSMIIVRNFSVLEYYTSSWWRGCSHLPPAVLKYLQLSSMTSERGCSATEPVWRQLPVTTGPPGTTQHGSYLPYTEHRSSNAFSTAAFDP